MDRLCDICRAISFEKICYSVYWYEEIKLGSLGDIFQRSFNCAVCQLLVRNREHMFSAGHDDAERAELYLYAESRGSRPLNGDSLGGQQAVNWLVVGSKPAAQTDLYLAACSNPVPSIQDFWNSSELYLRYSGRSFSNRLIEPIVNIKLLKKWIGLCQSLHSDSCESPEWLRANESPKALRLVDTKAMCIVPTSQNFSYVCLSYVWGSPTVTQSFRATKATIDMLQKRGSLHKVCLPRTISDAIRLVQDMGESYLWVDSLCIVQDDHLDKSFYLSQMDLIYARAIFTVVVATGDDSEAGIPHLYHQIRTPRQDFVSLSPTFGLIVSDTPSRYGPEESRWAYRGWTYQELQLSRRAIVFFKHMVHWKCECDYWNENTCLEPSEPDSEPCYNKMGDTLNLTCAKQRFSIHNLTWHVYHYNYLRQFSAEGDAIDAFRGILNRTQFVSGIEFHWGLPRQDFTHALLWKDDCALGHRKDLRRCCNCIIVSADNTSYFVPLPSWSWLGWYTRLGVPTNNAEGCTKDRRNILMKTVGWTSEWFQLGINGRVAAITSNSPNKVLHSLSPPWQVPRWTGDPLEHQTTGADLDFKDSGRIIARTSHAKLRVRTTMFDIESRRLGIPARDRMTYELIDSQSCVIGSLLATDIVCSVEEWDEQRMKKEKLTGRVRDFIAISQEIDERSLRPRREKRIDFSKLGIAGYDPFESLESDESDKSDDSEGITTTQQKTSVKGLKGGWLNLMMIQWDAAEPGVASRLGIFTIEEQLWAALNPKWTTVVLK